MVSLFGHSGNTEGFRTVGEICHSALHRDHYTLDSFICSIHYQTLVGDHVPSTLMAEDFGLSTFVRPVVRGHGTVPCSHIVLHAGLNSSVCGTSSGARPSLPMLYKMAMMASAKLFYFLYQLPSVSLATNITHSSFVINPRHRHGQSCSLHSLSKSSPRCPGG